MARRAAEPGVQGKTPSSGRSDEVRRAHDQLRRWILNGEFEAGQPISQVQLAARLGVSRGPLREGLRMLQREGLVEQEHNHRARVTPFSMTDLDQLYGIRISLESLAVELTVPRLRPDDVERLDELLAEMDEIAAARDAEAWERPHRTFHRELICHAGQRIERLLLELSDHSERYRRLYVSQEPRVWTQGQAEHTSIVVAVKAGDAALAAERLARHLGRTALTLIAHAAPEYDPAAVRRALRLSTGERGDHR